jgi:predicted RNase H-like HicB family nuclease
MRWAIVIEGSEGNYGAYVPDLPGCVTTGGSLDEVRAMMREAIELHLDGMREDGVAIPEPATRVSYVEVAE